VTRRIGLLAMLMAALPMAAAQAKAMHMLQSHPAAQEIVDGKNAQYSVRFDGPVDHRQSQVFITDGAGKTLVALHPLLDAAPDVLFASGPRLGAGDYQLHWSVRSVPDGDVSSGLVPFKVKRN
jgi:methionine-rich copper-binding protein CopC